MLENGYIKIFRSLLKWEWYHDQNTKDLFIHLLLTVNYEPKKWRGSTINRGQRVASYKILADELRLSVRNIRTALKHLISTGEVTHQTTSEYGVFTVNNYDKFQVVTDEVADDRQTADSQATYDRQLWNKANKDKKVIKQEDMNTMYSMSTVPLDEIISAWNSLNLAQIVSIKNKRKESLNARIREFGTDKVFQAIENVKKSAFLRGQNKNNWVITFDWLIKPNNFTKVLEDNYTDKQKNNSPLLEADSSKYKSNIPEDFKIKLMGGKVGESG